MTPSTWNILIFILSINQISDEKPTDIRSGHGDSNQRKTKDDEGDGDGDGVYSGLAWEEPGQDLIEENREDNLPSTEIDDGNSGSDTSSKPEGDKPVGDNKKENTRFSGLEMISSHK